MKLRDHTRQCQCIFNREQLNGEHGTCKYGNCVEIYCPRCGGVTAGWGPLTCRCDPGHPRWLRHPGMMPSLPEAVKPSLRSQRRHRQRKGNPP